MNKALSPAHLLGLFSALIVAILFAHRNDAPSMSLPNIVVVGGSYVGKNAAARLAETLHSKFQIVLIEKNSHFQHLFAFPRYAVTSKGIDTRKAFIPYGPAVFGAAPAGAGTIVQAKVASITKTSVILDRTVTFSNQEVREIPYKYLVIATGTRLSPPGTLPGSGKLDGVSYLQEHAAQIERAQKIAIIGAGAVGVQMATDIKELFPEKDVTLAHSRHQVMNRFHSGLHELIDARARQLGVKLKLGSRVKLPERGFPTDGQVFKIHFENGDSIESDFAIICTGQIPQSDLVKSLSPKSVDASGFVKTRKTLQVDDPELPNVFAVGDVADTGAPKAARPGMVQAEVTAKNIAHLEEGTELEDYNFDPAGIHLTLGIKDNVIFRNPASSTGEPFVKRQDNGVLDMGIEGVWQRMGGPPGQYHL